MRRFTRDLSCPICGGRDEDPRGRGVRCCGFIDSTEKYCYCTREEHAGGLSLDERVDPAAYRHRLQGHCDCGVEHAPMPLASHTAARTWSAPLAPATAEYVYRDVDSRPLYRVTRHPLPDGDKTFRQWASDGRGGWRAGLHGQETTLYRLPEVVDALRVNPRRWIFVPEGEKDVDRLWSAGLVATCNTGGAGKWPEAATEHLRGARIVVIPDNDEPGWRKHLTKVGPALLQVDAEVRVLALPWVKEGGDVSDWLDAGGDVDELKRLALVAPVYASRRLPQQLDGNGAASPGGQVPALAPADDRPKEFQLVRLGDFLTEPHENIEYVVEGLIPRGGVAIIAAKPKVGKTTLARTLAASVARGKPFLGRNVTAGGAMYLALEESRPMLREKFAAMGISDTDQLWIHVGRAPLDALHALLAAVKTHKPALVVIDPLFRFTRVKDVSAYAEVTAALEDIVEAARNTRASMIVVHHTRKGFGEEQSGGGDEILGSTAIFGAVDSAIHLRKRLDGVRVVWTEQRYGQNLEPTVVTLDDRGRAQLGVALSAYERADIAQRLLAELQDQPRSEADLREATNLSGQKLGKVLRDLLGSGSITRDGEGKRGNPYTYSAAPTRPPDWVIEAFG